MNRVKIIQRFFTNSEAKKEATYQRQLARKKNILLGKVEIIEAYQLYKVNSWFKSNPFKKLGLPAPEQFMVIVHYSANVCIVIKDDKLKEKIVKSVREKKVKKNFFFIRLSNVQQQVKDGLDFNYVMNVSVPAWKYKYVTHSSYGKANPTIINMPNSIKYTIAA